MRLTSMERVLTTMGHEEPDRVPLFLLLTTHGARQMNQTIRTYFSKPANVVQAQLAMQDRYRHDCVVGFFFAAQEMEAFGGEVLFYDDGPPNAGPPVIQKPDQIQDLDSPDCLASPRLCQVLETIGRLKDAVGDTIPVLGVAISPFSLPVMQMGFEPYIQLIYDCPVLFDRLMEVNIRFCVAWANAQLKAGATAICYFDPVSSPTILPRTLFLETGFKVAQTVISRIEGPVGIHLASGRALPIIDDLVLTGTTMIGCSAEEDLAELKEKCRGRLTVLGNLNGVAMRQWSAARARDIVRQAVRAGGPGGGFILSDNHGEIPWQVKDEILTAISQAVHEFGTYPLAGV